VERVDPSGDGIVKAPNFIADSEGITDPLWSSFLTMDSTDNSISNQMLLLEKYEKAFGIQTDYDSPIALCTKKSITDVFEDSYLEAVYSRLLYEKAPQKTGMSLSELINLPNYELHIILRILGKMRKKEDKIIDNLDLE